MRLPERAPTLIETIEEIGPLRAGVLAQATPVDRKGRYMHWDELRRRETPSVFASHRQWWGITKMARAGLLKPIPLLDRHHVPFRFGMPDIVLQSLHRVDCNASGRIQMSEEVTSPETRDRYIVASLIEEAITSSQLEGAMTTRRAAKQMIRSGRKPRDKNERMIFNNYRAMEWIRSRIHQPLTVDFLLELHRIVTTDTLDSPLDEGRLRRGDEDVRVVDHEGNVLHSPPPAAELQRRMLRMCKFANGHSTDVFIHPVVRSVLLHFWLAYDHPFVDGNGRTARALFYWSMLHQGYWLTEFISISRVIKKAKSRYGLAFLHSERDENDATYFLVHQLEVVERAIDELHAYLGRTIQERKAAESLLRQSVGLNHRQMALLAHALRHPGTEYTFRSHQSGHRIVYQTARTDLLDLERRGLLEGMKVGKRFVFRAVADLHTAIQQLR